MSGFAERLGRRLDEIRSRGLWRELRPIESGPGARIQIRGEPFLNFGSNDYLGLAGHEVVKQAAAQAALASGAGSGASRLICGSLSAHHDLERGLARFKDVPATVVFGSGYAAALGTIPALVGTGDVVILDKLAHACLVDGARLSGARLRVFGHNDLQDLERILRWARESPPPAAGDRQEPAVLIVTESVFSMDGDQAPLAELVALKDRFGAWLLVDEAHATGIYGQHRRGLLEETGMAGQVEVQMGTLGKALGAAGGYIAGSQALGELLINRARSFIFSTAPPPAQTAAALAALDVVRSDEGARLAARLWERVAELRQGLEELGWFPPGPHEPPPERGLQSAGSHAGAGTSRRAEARAPQRFKATEQVQTEQVASHEPPPGRAGTPLPAACGAPGTARATSDAQSTRSESCRARSAILPLIVGSEAAALAMAEALRQRGLFVPAIRYPAVARGAARLRVTVSAAHTRADIEQLLAAIADFQVPALDPGPQESSKPRKVAGIEAASAELDSSARNLPIRGS